jgi:RibD C-terminal domain
MATVIYSMSVSLDGFIAGPNGEIDWAAPDEELMRFHNEQTRKLGAHLCGRGLCEDMLPWEVAGETRSDPQQLEFARIWKAIPKEDRPRAGRDADIRRSRRLRSLSACPR